MGIKKLRIRKFLRNTLLGAAMAQIVPAGTTSLGPAIVSTGSNTSTLFYTAFDNGIYQKNYQ